MHRSFKDVAFVLHGREVERKIDSAFVEYKILLLNALHAALLLQLNNKSLRLGTSMRALRGGTRSEEALTVVCTTI